MVLGRRDAGEDKTRLVSLLIQLKFLYAMPYGILRIRGVINGEILRKTEQVGIFP